MGENPLPIPPAPMPVEEEEEEELPILPPPTPPEEASFMLVEKNQVLTLPERLLSVLLLAPRPLLLLLDAIAADAGGDVWWGSLLLA